MLLRCGSAWLVALMIAPGVAAQEAEDTAVGSANPPQAAEAAPAGTGEDEGGPVPSAGPDEMVPHVPLEEPIGVPVASDFDEGDRERVGGSGNRGCGCHHGDGGVFSPAAGSGDLSENPSPCECTAWMSDAPEDAPILELRRDPFSIAPRGMIQLVGVPWQGDDARIATGAHVDEAGFRFRRVRLGLEGEMPFHFSWEIGGEFDEEGARLLDASLAFRIPYLDVVAGATKVAFSGSMLTPAAFQTFLSRPWGVDGESEDGRRYGIAPDRMLGLHLGTSIDMGPIPSILRIQAGVFNGNEEYFLGNDNEGMLYVARIECLPLGDMPDGQLEIADGDPRLRIGGSYYFNDDATGDWHAAEADLRFRWMGLTVEGEFLWSRFAPDALPEMPPDEVAETDRWAYYGQIGYLVVPDLLEIAARYDAYLLDDGIDDVNDRWAVGGVATLFLLRNRVKFQVEYMHQQENADPQADNDYVAMQLQGRF